MVRRPETAATPNDSRHVVTFGIGRPPVRPMILPFGTPAVILAPLYLPYRAITA